MTDTYALEVRRLRFLVKVYLACRLTSNRSLAIRSLRKAEQDSTVAKLLFEGCRARTVVIGRSAR